MSGTQPSAATPYLLLGDTRRHALAQRIGSFIGSWRQKWAGELTPQFFVDIPDGGIQPSASGWQDGLCFRAGAAREPHLALLIPPKCFPGIVGIATDRAEAWARPMKKESLAAELELAVLSALSEEVLSTAGFERVVLERTATSAAATLHELNALRYVAARIALGGAKSTFGMLLSPSIAGALMPTRSPSAPRERIERRVTAVTAQTIGIDAVLGGAEVSLQELTALAVGDVIVLGERLGQPSQVMIRGGERVAEAALGCLDGQRAIRVEFAQRKRS